MISIDNAYREAKIRLATVTSTPHLDAEILLRFALQKPHSHLYAYPEESIPEHIHTKFLNLMTRRMQGEPIAYITQTREFWSLEFKVTPDVLIPRPETECLVERVLALTDVNKPGTKLADLGTGSGAIALAIAAERPFWQCYATDMSHAALQIAAENAERFSLKNVAFAAGDWCQALPETRFQVIVSNPPYIATTEWPDYAANLQFEPPEALLAGADGLSAIKEIVSQAQFYLEANGYLIIEHGFSQGESVRAMFAKTGYHNIETLRDLAGLPRMTMACFS